MTLEVAPNPSISPAPSSHGPPHGQQNRYAGYELVGEQGEDDCADDSVGAAHGHSGHPRGEHDVDGEREQDGEAAPQVRAREEAARARVRVTHAQEAGGRGQAHQARGELVVTAVERTAGQKSQRGRARVHALVTHAEAQYRRVQEEQDCEGHDERVQQRRSARREQVEEERHGAA